MSVLGLRLFVPAARIASAALLAVAAAGCPRPGGGGPPDSAVDSGPVDAGTSDAGTTDAGPAAHRIGVRAGSSGAGEFFDRTLGTRFVPRGNNYIRLAPEPATCGGSGQSSHSTFSPGQYDAPRAEAALTAMAARGYNTVRVFFDMNCLGSRTAPVLEGGVIASFADFLGRAKSHGLYVMPTLDFVPDGYLAGRSFPPAFQDENINFLTTSGVHAWTQLWQDVASALVQAGAATDAILAYEIRNETYFLNDQSPLSLTSGSVTAANGSSYDMGSQADKQRMMDEGMIHAVNQIRAGIRSVDPTALVTIGFFAPLGPNRWRDGDQRIDRPGPLMNDSACELDFIDLHAYPGPLTLPQYAGNFELTPSTAKPILMGEMGTLQQTYSTSSAAAGVLQQWQVDSCSSGYAGWLLWTWDSEEQAGFWNDLSEGGVLDRALAPAARPAARPDACAAAPFAGEDLALGRPASASAQAQGAPGLAFDGRADTFWGAGAPAPQWIEIDLGSAKSLKSIRMLVRQSPSGQTTHRIWGRVYGGMEQLLATVSGNTSDGLVLTQSLSGSYRYLRVETTSSPSWVAWSELEVLAGP